MKAFVKISSTRNIDVTSGLNYQDVTNPDAHIPDRLKIASLWPKLTVPIKQGVFYYPSEITEWNTVKCLVKDKILTIGEFVDEINDENAIKLKQKLNQNFSSVKSQETLKIKKTGKKSFEKTDDLELEDLIKE